MSNLKSLIPDIEVLTHLATEELAGVVLKLADENKQNGKTHFQYIGSSIRGNLHDDGGYPRHRWEEAELALAEAWNWLTVQGLLIREPGSNGSSGWMVLSRRARKILESNSFKTYSQGVAFPKTILHPKIAEEVWLDIARGDFETAVFKSFRAVEVSVRNAAGFPETEIGTVLMRKAFDADTGPLSDERQPHAERQALAHLFAGAIGSYKNPHSHRTVKIDDVNEAQEIVILASHLLRIVDSRTK